MPEPVVDAAEEPALARVLEAAGLTVRGRYFVKRGWVSRAWVGDEIVVRIGSGATRDAYGHEARVVELLADADVPHARHLEHGDGPDGAWSVSERLPGRTLHEVWPKADRARRRAITESLGEVLRALHWIRVPAGLRPPWLADALDGGPWPAYHPPLVESTRQLIDDLRQRDDHDPGLLFAVDAWVGERLPLFDGDVQVLVHGDLHGSNVLVDGDRVSGLVDFAEAAAGSADAELDTVLRWCARPAEFPPTLDRSGLDAYSIAEVPGWLRGAYPELFAHPRLRDRLDSYDLDVELAIAAHHPEASVRSQAVSHIAGILEGRSHLDKLSW